jgi:hypothetical protein
MKRWRFTETAGSREEAPISLSPRDGDETEVWMQILLIAACTLAIVWIIVLWGSRYFGPR